MCVVSMVMDHYADKWVPSVPIPNPWMPHNLPVPLPPAPKPITQDEVDEFRRLLERAREYDKRNNEPDCELEEKKDKVRKIAELLGLKVDFL